MAARGDGEFDLPAEAREVSDVTGAGDTVIAAMALGLAAGGSLRDAARLANRAAGLAVARFGPVAITAEELPPVSVGTPCGVHVGNTTTTERRE